MISVKNKFNKMYNGYVIYKITNPRKEIYIGATTDLTHRIETYKKYTNQFRNQKALYNSITEFKWENHKIEILYSYEGPFDIQQMVDKEFEFISVYFNKENCLNMLCKGYERKHIIKEGQK